MKKKEDIEEKILKIGVKVFVCWFLICHLTVWRGGEEPRWSEEPQAYQEDEYEQEKEDWSKVCVTVYNPVQEQCDSTPLITADNSEIDLAKLKKGKLKWVAVSRDLLKSGKVKYGGKVKIKCKQDSSISGTYYVHDTMHPKWKKHIDILAHQDVRTTGMYEEVEIEYLD